MSSLMSDKSRIYIQKWHQFTQLRRKYRFFMIEQCTENKNPTLFASNATDPLDFAFDEDYKIGIKCNLPPSCIIDGQCYLCTSKIAGCGFIGQLNFTCDQCVWLLFQHPKKSLIQKIRNLQQYNEQCVQLVTDENFKSKFYKMWYKRLLCARLRYDFYTENKHKQVRDQCECLLPPFNLPVFVLDED